MLVWGLWGETRVPCENQCRNRENMQTLTNNANMLYILNLLLTFHYTTYFPRDHPALLLVARIFLKVFLSEKYKQEDKQRKLYDCTFPGQKLHVSRMFSSMNKTYPERQNIWIQVRWCNKRSSLGS